MNVPSNLHINYSLKNIPFVSQFQYQKMLTARIEQLLGRMRWKLFWSKQERQSKKEFQTFGFKTPYYPPTMMELRPFEEELIQMIQKVEMRYVTNQLQDQMKEDIKKIKSTNDVIVEADKTANLYFIKPDTYTKYLQENITTEYKKTTSSTLDKINREASTTARKFQLDDRIEAMAIKPAYLSLKDHKEDFPARLKFRLINPCKSNMGIISKCILERVNKDVRVSTGLQQWRSTEEVLTWFKSLDGKQNKKWIKFDIDSFYPTITKELLTKAMLFAKRYTTITTEEEEVIMHSRKIVLVGEKDTIWTKKTNQDFDVSMGCMDGAEVSEMVGLYLLFQIKKIMPDGAVGLYRDDGLAAIEGNGQQVERKRKKLESLFQKEGLKITSEGNLEVVDYLDVVLDLRDNSFKPFTKTNANTMYVSPMSSHPPSIIANIPDAISRRLSSISSTKEMFDKEVGHYQQALDKAGYENKLEFKACQQEERRRKRRSRQVIWFNPPFASNVKTNVAKLFLTILRKHFPPTSDLYKLFNTKKVKVSYSCCPSMKSIIASHNNKITRGMAKETEPGCNCRGGLKNCPLEGRCQTQSLVYQAEVTSNQGIRTYIGQAASTFKLRYNNHTNSYINPKKKHETTLSTYVWKLKSRNVDFSIKYSTLSCPKPYTRGGRSCDLCLMEKTLIARNNSDQSLNKRTEVMAKCRHKAPHLLDNYHQIQLPVIDEAEPDDLHDNHPYPTLVPDNDLNNPIEQPPQPEPDPDPVEVLQPVQPTHLNDHLQLHKTNGPLTRSKSRNKK